MSSSFSERFAHARKESGASIADIANHFGVSAQAVYGWEQGAVPKADRINKLAHLLNVPVQWLAYGEGECKSFKSENGTLTVPMLNTQVSAGGGEFGEESNSSIVKLIDLDPKWVNDELPAVNKSNLCVYSVSGDSMIPTLGDNDIILVDNSCSRITRDGLFVVIFDGMLFSKRFQPLPGRKLLMLSDNKMYKEVEIDLNAVDLNFHVLGRIVYSWSGERH